MNGGGLMHFEGGGPLHQFSAGGGAQNSSLFFDPDDTYYIGYDEDTATCLRPREVYVTREVGIGGPATVEPQLGFYDSSFADEGVVCQYGRDPNAYLLASFINDLFGYATPLALVSTEDDMVLLLVGSYADGADNDSVVILADLNSATIDAEHHVLTLGWRDDADANVDLFYFKDSEMEIVSAGTAQVLGTGVDAMNAIGVEIGSDNTFSTAGAKLVSFINNATERAYVDYRGELAVHKLDNGQLLAVQVLTELTTIAAAAYTDTTIQIPADALVVAVSVYTQTVIPTATTYAVGVSGATTRYGTGIGVSAGTSNPGTDDGIRFYTGAIAIRITPSASPAAATGRVRVTIHYITVTAPTS